MRLPSAKVLTIIGAILTGSCGILLRFAWHDEGAIYLWTILAFGALLLILAAISGDRGRDSK
jgi:hypothetical protein